MAVGRFTQKAPTWRHTRGHIQVRSLTNAPGKAVNGVSHEATNWRGTTANTLVPNLSSATTATDVFPGLITWLCTWSDISKAERKTGEREREWEKTSENEEENRCAPSRREHSQQTLGAQEGSGCKRHQEEHARQRGQALLDSTHSQDSPKAFSSAISHALPSTSSEVRHCQTPGFSFLPSFSFFCTVKHH